MRRGRLQKRGIASGLLNTFGVVVVGDSEYEEKRASEKRPFLLKRRPLFQCSVTGYEVIGFVVTPPGVLTVTVTVPKALPQLDRTSLRLAV